MPSEEHYMLDKSVTHFLYLILTVCISHPSYALEYLDDQRNINYTRLNYGASKLFMSFDTDVTLNEKPVNEVARDLVTPKEGNAIVPDSGSVYIVTTDSSFFGKHTTYTMWFDEGAAILQRLKELRRGSKSNAKLYRFATNGKYDFRFDFNNLI